MQTNASRNEPLKQTNPLQRYPGAWNPSARLLELAALHAREQRSEGLLPELVRFLALAERRRRGLPGSSPKKNDRPSDNGANGAKGTGCKDPKERGRGPQEGLKLQHERLAGTKLTFMPRLGKYKPNHHHCSTVTVSTAFCPSPTCWIKPHICSGPLNTPCHGSVTLHSSLGGRMQRRTQTTSGVYFGDISPLSNVVPLFVCFCLICVKAQKSCIRFPHFSIRDQSLGAAHLIGRGFATLRLRVRLRGRLQLELLRQHVLGARPSSGPGLSHPSGLQEGSIWGGGSALEAAFSRASLQIDLHQSQCSARANPMFCFYHPRKGARVEGP